MNHINDLIDYINKGTSPFHAVLEVKRRLDKLGYKELKMGEEWIVEKGSKYYISPYPTCCFIFDVSKNFEEKDGFRIIASHTDSPCFRIKPSPEITENNYMKLNTEVYGGPILNTWFDRPLSLAGKVAIKSNDVFKPEIQYIDLEKAILTIPNLAIHMNREINKGVEINKQIDVLPLIGLLNEELNKDNYFMDYLADRLDVSVDQILDFDLYMYVMDESMIIGLNDEFISAPRLDDLAMVHASITALLESIPETGVNCVALFDNEEIGSKTKQGADSTLFAMVLERFAECLYSNKSNFNRALFTSTFMISADGAHALHPNKPQKHDPTNRPELGKGIVVKLSGNHSYVTDSESIAIFQQLCQEANVPFQKFVNHSNETGGKTLGPIASSYIPIRAVDVGHPTLAMHSAKELIACSDHLDIIKIFNKFFTF